MNTVTSLTPAPWCPMPRAYTRADDTAIRRTIEEHTPPATFGDDYDLVWSQDWLSAPGGFR